MRWTRATTTPHNLYRTREHPLSARSPRYDTRDLLMRKLTMLNSSFFGGIIMAAVRVALGGLKGCYHDCYFPVMGQSEDYNSLQTGIDAVILAIYVAALLAAVVAEHCDEEVLDSLWLTLMPLVAFPAICFGFYLRAGMLRIRRQRRRVRRRRSAMTNRCCPEAAWDRAPTLAQDDHAM